MATMMAKESKMHAMFRLFRTETSDPKSNAQRNLADRTHYVDDDSLRFHNSKILSTHVTDNGLLFALVESVSLDWEHTKRGFRYVVFDISGSVVSRLSLEDCSKTRAAATKAMWTTLNTIDAHAVTAEAIDREERHFAQAVKEVRDTLAKLTSDEAA